MSCMRVFLAIVFPPFAVVDKGCGSFLIVFILTCCGWIPGVIGALIILNNDKKANYNKGYDRGYNQGYNQASRFHSNQQPSRSNQPHQNGGWKGW